MQCTKLTFIVGFLLCFTIGIAQTHFQPQFRQINTESGHINHIMRDSEGYLWVSTQDGLLTYNGAQWEQFNHSRKDSFSISDNYVWLSYEDKQGNIWAGTFDGNLCKFDKKQRKFYNFSNEKTKNGVRGIYQYSEDYLLIFSDQGIYNFNIETESYEHDSLFLKRQFDLELYHPIFFMPFGSQKLLIGGEDKVYFLSLNDNALQPVSTNPILNEKVSSIIRVNNQYVIAGESSVYYARFDSTTNSFELIDEYLFNDGVVISTLTDIENNLILVGSNIGLFTIDLNRKTTSIVPSNNPDVGNGLTDKIVYSASKIEDHLYWVGTKTSIYEFSTLPNRFNLIEKEYLCNTSVLGMVEDNSNNLWIATRNGLTRIENFNEPAHQWKYHCYNKNNVPGFRNNYIINVMFIDNELWLGYRRTGMTKFELDKNGDFRFLSIPEELDSLTKNQSVSLVKKDSKGDLWIATSGNGAIKWNVKHRTFQHFKREVNKDESFSDNYVFDFEELTLGQMSIATAKGISMVDLQSGKIKTFVNDDNDTTTLSGNFVMDFHQDESGNKWVCTSGGLNLWNNDNTFTSWTKGEDLPNDVIYRMESIEGENWISSNKGLIQIKNENPLELRFRNFTTDDGVINNEHNQFSSYHSANGNFFFGGNNGLTYFNPKTLANNSILAKPVIQSFKLFNEDASHLLDQHIAYTKQITLNYNQNFLSFDLAALSYYNAHQNQFQYKMEGLNNEWISLNNRNYLSFNGLAPGNYNLLIKASNNDGVWNEKPLTLKINIKKPLWNRWYAWLLYLTIIASIIFYIYTIKLNSIKKVTQAKEDERNKIRERSARDFHDEAGTIITRLSLLAQYLRIQIGEDQKEFTALQQLENNIQKLRSGMRDFIWVLDPSKDSWHSTIQKLNEMGNQLFEHSGVKFSMISKDKNSDEIQLESIQRRQLLLIVKEGMNNILKHAKANTCVLEVENDQSNVTIKLIDDGVGLSAEKSKNGFGLKNLEDRAHKIGGELTVSNQKEGGTALKCQFPIHPNGL